LEAGAVVDRLARTVGAVERRETHGSWVLLTRTRAFKIKKPVVMAFLDYGTLARRREMCRAEVELNRRTAPGIYLGVRAIVAEGEHVTLAPEQAPGAIEYAVEMRRFPEEATLAAALAAGTVTGEDAERVGERIAAFHAHCDPVEPGTGAEAVKRSLDDDFASLGSLLSGDETLAPELVAAERCAAGFLGARWAELDARAGAGRVRDGHGDLRAEHVLLGPEGTLVDAIEFDPGLRRIDVGLDLAFLVMDLNAAGRADLARSLVRGYRDAGGDSGDDRLIAFFAAYRARVRAKVALLRARQLPADAAAAADERQRAVGLLGLGSRLLWEARQPAVIAIAGVAASGKSTLAGALGERAGRPVLSSDVVRKGLVGLAPADRAPESAYGADVSHATYRELGRLAAAEDGTVVVDATFHRRVLRDVFRAALGPAAARLLFVECRAPAAELERRVRARARDPLRVSDATAAVLRRQLADRDPLDEIPAGQHMVLRSDQPVEALVAEVEEALDVRAMRARNTSSAISTSAGNGSTSSTASSGSAAVPNTPWSTGT
jgi:aminoglycoside phosphotransferase family enzyme/predicted kinase